MKLDLFHSLRRATISRSTLSRELIGSSADARICRINVIEKDLLGLMARGCDPSVLDVSHTLLVLSEAKSPFEKETNAVPPQRSAVLQ